MGDVLFVRELAADRDLVLAFASDGTPAWAMDLESGLQWWYPGGDRDDVRDAIHDRWDTFSSMPIAAASYGGPHPAVELARRTDHSTPVVGQSRVLPTPVLPQVLAAARELPAPVRLVALGAAVVAAVVAVPLVLVLLLGGLARTDTPAVDDSTTSVPAVQTAGTRCAVLGETARDAGGHALVCVPPSRAFPSVLDWRATS